MPESISISGLSTAAALNNSDLIEIAQANSGSQSGYISAKTTLSAVADKIANGIQFAGLDTENKDIIGAINEAAQSGGGGGGGGINYSTNEQSTGLTWVDGKTVYQKTFVNTNLQHDSDHGGAYNLGTMPTFESLVGYEGFACESTGVGWTGLNGIEAISGWGFGFHITSGLVLLYPAGGTPSQMSVIEGGKAWVTVKYTKPTT